MSDMDRRRFIRSAAAAGVAISAPDSLFGEGRAPAVHAQDRVAPKVIADRTGYTSRDEDGTNAVSRALRGITEGEDVLDALLAGVNIPERDPGETGVGFGGVPNAEGVVQLDAACMHGPRGWAGGVGALEGVRTPSLVARDVMAQTDHHLLAGDGAQQFARQMGYEIEDSLTTENSLRIWREWKRRIDPEHWLDPSERQEAGRRAAREMMREGLVDPTTYWGTIHCAGITPSGDVSAVTTTSGLWFKVPGRVGDSPILGAGLYVDNDVGTSGSTGRGEANLYNLSSFRAVQLMRDGRHPKDAGMEALRRIRESTRDPRLMDEQGRPAFNVRFFLLNRKGEHAGVAMYAGGDAESEYALCTEEGAELLNFEPLLEGGPAG